MQDYMHFDRLLYALLHIFYEAYTVANKQVHEEKVGVMN